MIQTGIVIEMANSLTQREIGHRIGELDGEVKPVSDPRVTSK
jgi:hypothetical protein